MNLSRIITGLFLITALSGDLVRAQQDTTMYYSDVTTYRQYMEMQWDSLIESSNYYLRNGVDYYYLRVRLAIAYYNKKNYVAAARQFKKALAFNPSDPVANEYLYYCSYFSGNDFEAAIRSNKLSASRREELGIKKHFIQNISVDLTEKYTPEIRIPSLTNSSAAGQQQVPHNLLNGNITISQLPFKRFKLTEAYTYLQKSSSYYYKDATISGSYTNNMYQNQFFVSGTLYPLSGLELSGSYHALLISFPYAQAGNGNSRSKAVSFSTLSDYSGSVSLKKSFGYFGLEYTYTSSSLNYYRQKQHALNLGIYPLGNLNLYILNKLTFFEENTVPARRTNILSETLGFKISRHFWAEAGIMTGDIRNFSDFGSYIIYNDVNTIRTKTGVTLLFPLKSGITLSLRSAIYRSESAFSDPIISNAVKYLSYSFTGGISWNL